MTTLRIVPGMSGPAAVAETAQARQATAVNPIRAARAYNADSGSKDATMPKLIALMLTLACFAVFAQDTGVVDLDDPAAVTRLKETKPEHYEKIRRILTGLAERPQRASERWLEVNFNATGVYLSAFLYKTSLPPKQHLQFRLDDTSYSMNLTRSDITASFVPVK
jgi:hypothetical protein